MDGCTHTEHSDEGKIENTSSDDDRIIFLLVYFGAIVLMCGCGKVAACCFGGEEGHHGGDQFDPSCCSGDWLASKLGVLNKQTGELLSPSKFWWAQHDLAQLCVEVHGQNARFKVANFLGDLAFATSTALMLQSVNIGATSRSTSDICQQMGGGGSSISTHTLDVEMEGDGSGGFTFENTGGTEVGENRLWTLLRGRVLTPFVAGLQSRCAR